MRVYFLPASDWMSSAGCLCWPCLQRSSWRLNDFFFSLISRFKKEVTTTSHGAGSKRCVKGIKQLVGLKDRHAWRGWLSGIRLGSCIDILTHLHSQASTERRAEPPVHWSTTSCCRPAPQSHLLQNKPSAPPQGVPQQKAAPCLHKNAPRRGDFYHWSPHTPLIFVPKCAIYRGARLAAGWGRALGRVEHRLLFALSSSAHTKHSSPPTSTRARARAYTPSSSSYPSPRFYTHYMSENEDAMKYKQGAGPDRRSHSPYKPRKRAHARAQAEWMHGSSLFSIKWAGPRLRLSRLCLWRSCSWRSRDVEVEPPREDG